MTEHAKKAREAVEWAAKYGLFPHGKSTKKLWRKQAMDAIDALEEENAELRAEVERFVNDPDVEAVWKATKGINPETGRMWLTPRMIQKAERTRLVWEGENERLRSKVEQLKESGRHFLGTTLEADSQRDRLRAENERLREEARAFEDALGSVTKQMLHYKRILEDLGVERLAEENERLREKLASAVARCEPWRPDHACVMCVPDGDLVKDGFRCAKHILYPPTEDTP